jgi:hypothetical protein
LYRWNWVALREATVAVSVLPAETNWAGRGLTGGSKDGGEAMEGSMYYHRSLLTAFVLINVSQRVQSFGDLNRTTAVSPVVAMVVAVAVCQ